MSNTPSASKSNKAVIWAIIVVLALVLAAFSAYKSFIAPHQGKSIGQVEMFPGGKKGLMQGGPAAGEGMEQPAQTPAGGR